VSFPKAGVKKAGYMIKDDDEFHLIVDLKNLNTDDKTVFLTSTYDFIPGPGSPKGWNDVRPIWLDVAQCSTG